MTTADWCTVHSRELYNYPLFFLSVFVYFSLYKYLYLYIFIFFFFFSLVCGDSLLLSLSLPVSRF